MKKSFLSSVILTAVISLSTSAFASTQVTKKAHKDPVKVETKLANHKKSNTKISLKKADKKAKKVEAKSSHSMDKKAK